MMYVMCAPHHNGAKVRARGLVTHTLGAISPLPSASFAVQPMTGAFLCRRPPQGPRPPKAVRPTDTKNGKNRHGSFDFAIWHGIVVSCSGKARGSINLPAHPHP